jgi:subtilisin family serine protease
MSVKPLLNSFSRQWDSVSCFRTVSVLIGVLALFSNHAFAQQKIQLNSRTVEPSKTTTEEFIKALQIAPSGTLHGLARVARHLTQKEREALAKFGIHVLEPFKKNTYWVSVAKHVNLPAVQAMQLNMDLIRLRDEDRVDPRIWRGDYERYLVTPPGEKTRNYVLNADGTVNLTVQFHADVPEIEIKEALQKHVKALRKKSAVMWVIVIPRADVPALAADDRVQWIAAGPLPFLPENDHTRTGIKVDSMQTLDPATGYVTGWNGAGVKVGVFDAGIDESHPDLTSRVIVNLPQWSDHGTGMAATVAGRGGLSAVPCSKAIGPCQSGTPFEWRGMATGVLLIEEMKDNGDDAMTHSYLISNPGMHLSNHSYVVGFDGEYSLSDRAYDGIVRGTGIATIYLSQTVKDISISFPPRLSVFSAGNGGRPISAPPPYQSGYFSLTKQLKNGLVVGNWNYAGEGPYAGNRGKVFPESSLGPAHDGRIKPDVVAPGTSVTSSISYSAPPYYGSSNGTSAAAAAVTGTLALVLQRYASVYHVPDLNVRAPLPSTLRAVMIHTAEDKAGTSAWFCNNDGPPTAVCPVAGDPGHAVVQATPGPDFVTGWGLIDAEKAVDIVAKQLLREGTVNECETKTYTFSREDTTAFRVTLAWDDPPFAGPLYPFTDPRLVNDLDLILIDPNGTIHYPWKLDQKIVDTVGNEIPDTLQTCGMDLTVQRQFMPTGPSSTPDTIPPAGIPVAVRGKDHLNNVEVVDVSAPVTAGTWQVQVMGFSIPQGPQAFSLVGQSFSVSDQTPPAAPTNLRVN